MSRGLAKADLEKLSEARLDDARLLFQNERWSGAYYIAGYAVELALKACIAKQIFEAAIPDKKFIQDVYTHDFGKLVKLAGLVGELRRRQDADSRFAANWAIACEWLPDARYEPTDKSSAHYLLDALAGQEHGVMAWIRAYW